MQSNAKRVSARQDLLVPDGPLDGFDRVLEIDEDFTHPFRLTALYACACELCQLIDRAPANTARYQPSRGLWGLTQANGEGRTFRVHRIPVIRAAREPPCIGGRTEMLKVMQKLEEMAAHAAPEQRCTLLVRPGKEQDAGDSFRGNGLRAYWPNYYSVTRWSPQRRERRRTDFRSVIPGYLFVAGPPTQTFWDVIERNVRIVSVFPAIRR
jgi:hypothetical protein